MSQLAADLSMPHDEAELLRAHYGSASIILEYGSGGSTLLAASMPGKYVVSVDHDARRAMTLQTRIDQAALPSPAVVWHAEAGSATSAADQLQAYLFDIWTEPFFRQPDLVFIQGKWPAACLLATALRTRKLVTVLVADPQDQIGEFGVIDLLGAGEPVGGFLSYRLDPASFAGDGPRQEAQALLQAVQDESEAPRMRADPSTLKPDLPVAGLLRNHSRPHDGQPDSLYTLFRPGWQGRARTFFERNRARARLLAHPTFLDGLAEALGPEGLVAFPVTPIPLQETLDLPVEGSIDGGQTESPLYVVADPADESAALDRLAACHPSHRFIGFVRDLVPALMMQRGDLVFSPIPTDLQVTAITLILATPRSGSSLLADIVTDIGAGNAAEHLRYVENAILGSDYCFDLRAAFRNVLNFGSVRGRFATKVITHFAQDALTTTNAMQHCKEQIAGIPVHVVLLDRSDKAAQAVSGYFASQRGLWHVTSNAEQKRFRTAGSPHVEFHELLGWYFDYQWQSRFLATLRPAFEQMLVLNYESDLLNQDLTHMAERLTEFLELPRRCKAPVLKRTRRRLRLSNETNRAAEMAFRDAYFAIFRREP